MYANYGYKSSEELIHGYGFMLEDNPADFFQLSIGMKAQTDDGMRRSVILASMHLPLSTGVGRISSRHAALLLEQPACGAALRIYGILFATLEGLATCPGLFALLYAGHCSGPE